MLKEVDTKSHVLFENNVLHNAVLGATLLWSFTYSYYEQKGRQQGPGLHELMLVLPVALHAPSMNAIYSKNRDGALPKALAEERSMVAGIQTRIEGYADRTLRSCRVGVAAALLVRDGAAALRVVPGRRSMPVAFSSPELKQMHAAADRLGHWVALSGFRLACSMLGVRF